MGPGDDVDTTESPADPNYVAGLVDYQEYDQASVPNVDETPLTEDDYN